MNPIAAQQEPWIGRALQGDQRAFAALYNAHVDGLFCFLQQFSRDREQTADWVQNTFIKAFTGLSRFEGRSSFKTWLFRIAINEMKTGVRRWQPETEAFDEAGSEPLDHDPLLGRDLSIWISKLDERPRMVLLLAEAEGYAHSEIAALLEIPESSSRVILARAKAKLRALIQKDESYGTQQSL